MGRPTLCKHRNWEKGAQRGVVTKKGVGMKRGVNKNDRVKVGQYKSEKGGDQSPMGQKRKKCGWEPNKQLRVKRI